MKLTGDGSV